MAEYIEREAVLEIINRVSDRMLSVSLGRKVVNLPAANVATVVHGRWIWKGRNWGWICSECESGCMLNCESDWYKSDFCPHCGADMRERKGDE